MRRGSSEPVGRADADVDPDVDVDPDEAAGEVQVVSRTCEVPDVSFRAFLAEQGPPRALWTAPDGLEFVGGGAAAALSAAGAGRFDDLRAGARRVFESVDHQGPAAARPRFVGGLAFDAAHQATEPWRTFPAASFVIPSTQLTRADGSTWLSVRAVGPEVDHAAVTDRLERAREALSTLPAMRPSGGPPGVASTRRTTSRDEWVRQVERAVERIRAGDLRKVVLATSLEVELTEPVDIPDLLERLRRTYPDCYRFLVQPTEAAGFFGPPPERLVRLAGRSVRTEALAGSVPRGNTPEEDAELADSLVDSEKIRHEQRLVVEAIRDQLTPLGEVREGDRGVRKLSNIQHLQTPIEATLDESGHVLDIVEALHPTPAVGGLPPDVAHRVITETESFARGWYAAPVGWFDAAGDGEFAVAIRSAVAGGDRARLFAGNGIVGDSDPLDEWDELGPKFRPVLDELER
jgi:menaquinone-specific isochorismate synthase